ncbi:MAG: DUF481 domain-containing protein [Deltaproteobacteria bacterium]|nr:DUF481 domain-containing protein [Deltaproteobacteria bacterium]
MYVIALTLLLSQTDAASQPADSMKELVELMRKTADAAERSAAAAERSARAAEKASGIEAPVAPLADGAAPAAEAPKSKVKLSGSASLSFVWLAGNSNALTGQLNAGLSLLVDKWTLTLKGNGAYGQSRGAEDTVSQVTALNVGGELRAGRNFTDLVSAYLLTGAGHDQVAKVQWRVYGEGGLGLTFFKIMDKDFIKFQLGADVGIRYQREAWFRYFPSATDPVGPIVNPAPNILAIKAGLGLRYAPTTNVLVTEAIEVLPDVLTPRNFMLNNTTALVVKLIGPLSLSTSFTLKFDNLPPPGSQKLDTILAFGADVSF